MSASSIIASIPISKPGLNYLVPTPWYTSLYSGGTNSVCSTSLPTTQPLW